MVRPRLVISGFLILGIITALLLTVHLPPVRSSLASWAAGRLSEAGIEARFEDVSYNLFAFSFTARDVVLAARGSEAAPFLRADELSVTLPWSVTRGRAAARAVRIINLQLDFLRRSDGTWNLPVRRNTRSSLQRFDVDSLFVGNASVRYRDESADVAVLAEGITIDFRPRSTGVTAGSLIVGNGPRIRVGDHESVALYARGRLAFDGVGVSVEDFEYRAPEGHLRAKGRLDTVFSQPRSAVETTGDLLLRTLSPWLALEPYADGTVAFAASTTGALADPEFRVNLDSKNVSWRHIKNVPLRVDALVHRSVVTVERATATLTNGMVVGRARIPLDGSAGSAHADWQGLSLTDLVGSAQLPPVAATLQGTVDVKWANSMWNGLDVFAENRATPLNTRSTVPLEGQSSLHIANGEWRLVHNHDIARTAQLTGVLRGHLSEDAFGRSTVTGTAEFAIEELPKFVASLRDSELALPVWMDELHGAAAAQLSVDGLLESPRVNGVGRIQEFGWKDVGPGDATFRLAADSRSLAINDLNAVLGANSVSGSASMQFASARLDGTARFDLKEPGQLLPLETNPWRPAGGAVTAQVEMGGALSSPTVMATFAGEGITIASQNVGTVNGRLEYGQSQVSVTELEVQQKDGGRVSAAGTFEPATGAFSLTVRGRDVVVTPVGDSGSILPVDAVMAVEFSSQGTVDHPRGGGRVTFSRLSWRDLPLGSAEANVELSDAGVHLDSRLPELNTRVGGTVQITAPWIFDLAADVVDADMSALRGRGLITPSGFFTDLEGHASFTATGTGNFENVGDSRVDIALRALEVQKQMSVLRLSRPATLQYERTRLSVEGLEVRTGDTSISATGGFGDSLPGLQIQLVGDLRDIGAWLASFRPDDRLSMEGAIDNMILASGSLERPNLTGHFTMADATVQVQDLPALEAASVKGELSEGVIVISEIGGGWQGATLSGRAKVPLPLFDRWLPTLFVNMTPPGSEGAEISLRVDNLTAAALGRFVTTAPERVEGTASAVLHLRSNSPDLEDLTGSLTVERLDGNVAGVVLTQTVPTRVEVSNGRVRIEDWVWDASGNRLAVSGEASLVRRELDVALIGRIDLRMIGGFVTGTTTAGAAEIGLRLTGPFGAPAIDGTLLVQDGELQSIDPQIVLDSVAGRILLGAGTVRVLDFAGSLNGGPFTLAGELRHEVFTITSGQLDFVGRLVALNVPQGFRTEVDAELALSFAAENPHLTGRATIQRGAYREPLSLAAGLVGAARRRQVTAGRQEATWVDQLSLNIAITSAEDLIVDNNYGRLDLALNVRLVGSAGKPSIVGRAEAREGGVLYLGGRTYQVESGVIDFVDQNEIRPDFNIVARTRVSGTDITLTITGPLDTLQGELTSSDPQFSQSDLASLLLTGRRSTEVGGTETTIAREQLIALLSGEVLGFAAQAVGLDTIRLESGNGVDELRSEPSLVAEEADPASRLTLSKNFSRYAEVVFSQDLRESGDLTWIFGVTPARGLEVRTVSRDDHSRSYEIRHDISFGRPGGVVQPTRSGRTSDQAERIAEIRFMGELGVPARELEALLKLRAGNRFDFYEWQTDRERLRRFYLERMYFEARVTARRHKGDEGAAGETILEYLIRPGVRTTLMVDGYPLPDRVRRDLEMLWSNAVFEEVLFTDIERRVRSFLIEEGYLGAAVTVSRLPSSTAGEKSIQVSISEGIRSGSRGIVFEGNEVIPTGRLETLVRERELESAAWVEPTLLERAVRELYEDEGLLNVAVVVRKPEITADRGILPVRISEGVRFKISEIVIAGVTRRPESEVREAFNLQAGQDYVWRDVERGRRAVEAAYRRQGFNAVRAETLDEVERARGEVRLTLTIEEGSQQVLQAVELEGAEGLRRESLSRALALENGQAADLSSWQQARRRLLDTGLFRRVDIEPVPIETPAPEAGTQPVAAHVTLDRWPLWRLRYGFEVADELAPLADTRVFGPGFTADLQRRTLWGLPVNVGTSFRMSRDDRVGRLFLTAPNFFTLPLLTSMFLSRSREDITETGFLKTVSDKTTVTAEQRFRRGRRMQFSYGYQYERNHTFDPNANPNDPFRIDLVTREARLTSTGLVDRRDDPFDATRGLMHSSTIEYGPEALGSDVRFIKYSAQQFYFRPLRARFVSATAFRVGVGRGFGGQDLISTERFYAGGANTVRGYREDSLGEIDFLGIPVGGQALMIFNQEARFPIYKWFRGVGFFDAGNVFPHASDLSFDLKSAVGLGLRLATPVGMFRVDVGVPLSAEDGRQTPRWYFSLGQMF